MNELYDDRAGGIMNATVNVVALMLASSDLEDFKDIYSPRPRRHSSRTKSFHRTTNVSAQTSFRQAKTDKHGGSLPSVARGALLGSRAITSAPGMSSNALQMLHYRLSNSWRHSLASTVSMEAEPRTPKRTKSRNSPASSFVPATVVVDEGEDNELAPLQVFHKLHLETDSHPFFKRVWTIRHELNECSPLLSKRARQRVQSCNKKWPSDWNSHAAVRQHLSFHKIIVNLSGTANASGSSVFAQKVYDYADVNIGYRFADMLRWDDKEDRIKVDSALLNDVLDQVGGGGEPFTNTGFSNPHI
jgi:hypothetical protein